MKFFDFNVNEYDLLAQRVLRPQLYDVLKQSALTQRFERLGLSDEAIKGENVLVHTLRLICRVTALPESVEENKSKYTIIVLLHDLPETRVLRKAGRTSDDTAPEKASSQALDQNTKLTEGEAAREMFNEEELKLYEEFELASDYLKGKIKNTPTGPSLLSKILDKIDSDMFYHLAVIKSLGNLGGLTEKGQSLAFEQYTAYSARLDSLRQTEVSNIAELCQELLDNCMLAIKDMWSRVPEDQIPQIIKKNLTDMQLHEQLA